MSKKSSPAAAGDPPAQQSNHSRPQGADIVDLLQKVDQLLRAGEPTRGLHVIAQAKILSPWATNAQGVCQLRLGNTRIALDIFRGLVLSGGIHFRTDVPAVFKTNFVVAMLLANDIKSGASILGGMRENEHPSVDQLKAAVQRWKQTLPLWRKIDWYLGGQPSQPFMLDFPPGELE
jgi:hypothetical protein